MSTTTDTLRLYSQSYRKHPWLFLGTLLMGPGFVLQNIVSPLFIAKILGQLANHQIVNTNYVLYAGISLLSGLIVSNIGDRYASMPLTALTMHDLYRKCVNRLMKQDYDFFANSFAGSLVTQANRLSKSYEIFVNTVYLEMLGIWFGVLTAIGIMIHYDATIGLTIGALWVVSIIIVMLLVRRRIPIRRAAVSKESELTGEIADIITNAVTIKTFAHEIDEEARYDKTNSELSARLHRSWRAAIGNHFIIQILCILIQLVVLVGGIHAVQHGTLTIATFLLFQVYILRIIDSISKSSL
jgi:ABC-type multidrug transport system fused ATPase/permease subunit